MLLLSAASAEPCDIVCVRATGADVLLSSRYVFLGKVTQAEWDGPQGTFTLEPIRIWKGGWPGDKHRFRVTTYGGGASCGYPLVKGAYYLVTAEAEPQSIRLCGHEPIPLSEGLNEVASLDRARHATPLELPEEALLSPSEWSCSPRPMDAQIDHLIQDSELVVLGRIASMDSVEHSDGRTIAIAKIAVKDRIKGRIEVAHPREHPLRGVSALS